VLGMFQGSVTRVDIVFNRYIGKNSMKASTRKSAGVENSTNS